MKAGNLRNKKVLIIDRDAKNENDHTWCFWEKEKGAFEEIIFRKWKSVRFHGTRNFSASLDLGEYEYKMIRAADFYKFVFEKLNQNPNFEFLQSEIISIENAKVETVNGEFSADEFVFDSFTRKSYDNPQYQNLFQHFHGWLIETENNIFNPNEPTLFDFRVEQKNECRFIYILPFSASQALVEFTVFSDNILKKNEYENNLKKYLADILKIRKLQNPRNRSGRDSDVGRTARTISRRKNYQNRHIRRLCQTFEPATVFKELRKFCRDWSKIWKLRAKFKIQNSKFKIGNYFSIRFCSMLYEQKNTRRMMFSRLFFQKIRLIKF